MADRTEQLERENRDLRLALGALLARADGRIEVSRAEMERSEPMRVRVMQDPVDHTLIIEFEGWEASE